MRRIAESALRRLWSGEPGALERVLSAALSPLELAYRIGVRVRNAGYDSGLLSSVEPPLPVLSVGNLAVGGTGKTPVSAWVARLLADRGRKPAVVLRGYGGDEMALHRRWNPDVTVLVEADRVRGARRAADAGHDVVILDDGFQHRRLDRTLDLVLLAAEDDWLVEEARPRLLPRGPLREPPAALRRADWAVITRRTASGRRARRAQEAVRAWAPGVGTTRLRLRPGGWTTLDGGVVEPPTGPLLAVAGIARPGTFEELVGALTSEEVELMAFPDHHPFTDGDLRRIRRRAGSRTVVTTEKDAIRLPALQETEVRVLRLTVELEADDGLVDALVAAARGSPLSDRSTGSRSPADTGPQGRA